MKPEKDITDPRMVKALAHPMRIRILATLDARVASPSELAGELDAPIGNVSYHVRILDTLGLIRLVRTTPKRGAIEHHYEALARPILSDDTWASIPDSVKQAIIGAALDNAGRLVSVAAAAGGFTRDEAHVTRRQMNLDAEGWDALGHELMAIKDRVFEIGQASETRLKESGEKGDTGVLLMMLFDAVHQQIDDAAKPQRRRRRRSTART